MSYYCPDHPEGTDEACHDCLALEMEAHAEMMLECDRDEGEA